MSEREIDARRNWKAQTFPYDYYTVEPGEECQYCLTEKQAEILRGIIEPLSWNTRWWSDTDQDIDQDVIQAFRDDLIRRLMMSCCGDEIPVQYRYSDDGVLQRSEDGGSTWEDAPDFDPRNYSPQFPQIPGEDGDDKKCAAAVGAAKLVKEQVGDQLTDDMGRYTLDQLVRDWVGTMIESSNPFKALVTVIANQIFALVISAVRAALTEEVYHQFECALYCFMDDDAKFNTTSWELVRLDILDRIPGVGGLFLEHLVYLLGVRGLTNVVRSAPDDTGDCSDCGCGTECSADNWQLGAWNGTSIIPSGTELDRGDDFITASSTDRGDGVQAVYFVSNGDATCCGLIIEYISGLDASRSDVMVHCGVSRVYTNLAPVGLTPEYTSQNAHAVLQNPGFPFTIKINFIEPPP